MSVVEFKMKFIGMFSWSLLLKPGSLEMNWCLGVIYRLGVNESKECWGLTKKANTKEAGQSDIDRTSERTGSVVPRPKMFDLTIFHGSTENL